MWSDEMRESQSWVIFRANRSVFAGTSRSDPRYQDTSDHGADVSGLGEVVWQERGGPDRLGSVEYKKNHVGGIM